MDEKLEQTPEQIIDISKKEKVITTQKNIFSMWFLIFCMALGLLLLGGSGFYVYYNYYRDKTAPPTPTPPQNTIEVKSNPEVEVSKTILYRSDNLKLSIEYPKEAKLVDTWPSEGQTKKLEIFYDQGISNYDTVKEEDIKFGYVFRISTFNTEKRTLSEIVETKENALRSQCPSAAEFSQVYESQINEAKSLSFDVKKCNGDIIYTYLTRFGVFYEFMQEYRGDIGYKQVFKATTSEIISSIRFYPENEGPEEPYVTYNNDDYRFSFKHPRFDTGCCEIDGPPSTTMDREPTRLLVIADPNNIVDKKNFDGIGLFAMRPGNTNGFEDFVTQLKKVLIDDYTVVKGRSPTPVEKQMKVGTKEAVRLSGFTWQGNDLIVVYNGDQGNFGRFVLVIAVKNISGSKFEDKLDDILATFDFRR